MLWVHATVRLSVWDWKGGMDREQQQVLWSVVRNCRHTAWMDCPGGWVWIWQHTRGQSMLNPLMPPSCYIPVRDSDLIHLFVLQQLQEAVAKIQSRLLRANDVSCFLRVVSGTDAPTCYRAVTVLINIGASGGLIYYCAPGLKLSWVSSYTAQGVSSDKGPSAVLP